MRVDVDDRARGDLGAGGRVVVGRVARLDDEHSDAAVAPSVDAVDVVVPEDVVQQRVGVPPVADELDAGALAGGVIVGQWTVECDRVGDRVDRHDRCLFDALRAEADAERDTGPILRIQSVHRDGRGPCGRGRGQRGVLDRVRPDRVLVAVPDRCAIGPGGVELHVVDVHLDFGEAAEDVFVAFLRCQT